MRGAPGLGCELGPKRSLDPFSLHHPPWPQTFTILADSIPRHPQPMAAALKLQAVQDVVNARLMKASARVGRYA